MAKVQRSRAWGSSRWGTLWSLLVATALVAGLLCGLHAHGLFDSLASILLLTLLGVTLTTSAARAIESPFAWRLVGWPLLGSVVAFGGANLIDQVGWPAVVAVAGLALTSPWALALMARTGRASSLRLTLGRLGADQESREAQTVADVYDQAEVDARFDEITSQF
jgi:hypothetical protein